MTLRCHAQTAGSSLTAQQLDNNVVRVTLQALAAVLGGTQSLHTNGKDEALALPTEDSARLALRTQQVIANESGVADTVDPLGGSYFVETLTDELERRALEYIEQIDGMGGAVSAIEQGFMQREIQNAAYRYQQEIERKERTIVGVNALHARARAGARDPADQARARGAPEGARSPSVRAERAAKPAARRARRGRARRARRRQPDAGDRRGGARVRDPGRDLGRDAPGVRRVPAGRPPLTRRGGRPWKSRRPPDLALLAAMVSYKMSTVGLEWRSDPRAAPAESQAMGETAELNAGEPLSTSLVPVARFMYGGSAAHLRPARPALPDRPAGRAAPGAGRHLLPPAAVFFASVCARDPPPLGTHPRAPGRCSAPSSPRPGRSPSCR